MKRLLISSCLALLPIIAAQASPPPTAPGKYKNWDGEVDEVEIVQPFHLHDYGRLLVLPIDGSKVERPTDNTREPVEEALIRATEHFSAALGDDIPDRMNIKIEPAPGNTALKNNPGALILRAGFTEMNPGSAVARIYSRGFAGATFITLQGEFIDGASGKVLLRFTHGAHKNQSGLFQRYVSLMEDAEDRIAGHLSKLIKAFYP